MARTWPDAGTVIRSALPNKDSPYPKGVVWCVENNYVCLPANRAVKSVFGRAKKHLSKMSALETL